MSARAAVQYVGFLRARVGIAYATIHYAYTRARSRQRVEGLDRRAAHRARRRIGGEDELDLEILRHRGPVHMVVSVVELRANNRHAHPILLNVRGVEPEVHEALLVRLLQLDRCVNVDLDWEQK